MNFPTLRNQTPKQAMRIAVQGCCHDELDKIYAKLAQLQGSNPVDLLLICGDFQGVRSKRDFGSISVPPKYLGLGDFQDYWSGRKRAPLLTIVVGGNHEVSDVLCANYYGGWLAHNIFYLGHSGCVLVGGLRICGISGIHAERDYELGYHESFPFNPSSLRSVYHTRSFEVTKLAHMKDVDVFISHDWPRRIYNYGDLYDLLRKKPGFRPDIQTETLGCPGCEELLGAVKPTRWFAAHHHCAFEATVPHQDGHVTEFLALDKCIRSREHLRVIDLPVSSANLTSKDPTNDICTTKPTPTIPQPLSCSNTNTLKMCFDTRWLSILYLYQDKIPRQRAPHRTEGLDEQLILDTQAMLEAKLNDPFIPSDNDQLANVFTNILGIKPANILTRTTD